MDSASIYGQGISFPPRLGPDGRMAWSSGPDNIREGIQVTLLTSRGERLMLSDFGGSLRTFLFEPNTTATRRLVQEDIEKALGAWEPRISVQSVDVTADPNDSRAVIAVVAYQLAATQESGQLALQIQLGG